MTKKVAIIGYLIIGFSFLIEGIMLINVATAPRDVILYALLWLLTPHLVMLFFLLWHLRSASKTVIIDCAVIFVVSTAGLYVFLSEKGGWAVFVVPALQIAAFIIIRFLVYLALEGQSKRF